MLDLKTLMMKTEHIRKICKELPLHDDQMIQPGGKTHRNNLNL
jgi:hypothetical protein